MVLLAVSTDARDVRADATSVNPFCISLSAASVAIIMPYPCAPASSSTSLRSRSACSKCARRVR